MGFKRINKVKRAIETDFDVKTRKEIASAAQALGAARDDRNTQTSGSTVGLSRDGGR